MTNIDKVLYTGRVHIKGGRAGSASSDDGRLNIALTDLGKPGDGTNPEQLFAAGWSACFLSAIELAARARKVSLPGDRSIDAEVDIGTNEGGYLLGARLHVNLPGLDRELAQELIDTAHQTCPYSKVTRGNIAAEIRLA